MKYNSHVTDFDALQRELRGSESGELPGKVEDDGEDDDDAWVSTGR